MDKIIYQNKNQGSGTPFTIQALKNEPITVYGDGTQTRSFCYIDDLVEGIFRMATIDKLNGEVINLGNPDEYKIIDFAQIIKELTNSKSPIVFKPLLQDDPKQRKPDITKAKKILNWEPKINLEKDLKITIKFFKGN